LNNNANNQNGLILFRVDASTHIGSGHLMRCLALALHMKAMGFEVAFVMRHFSGELSHVVKQHGINVHMLSTGKSIFEGNHHCQYGSWLGVDYNDEIKQVTQVVLRLKPSWVVVDHYGIDDKWHEKIQDLNCQLVVIDDLADRQIKSDIVVDQNYLPHYETRYEALTPKYTNFLLGPKFALLRQEFNDITTREILFKSRIDEKIICICFGGSDLSNETMKALRGLLMVGISDFTVNVIVGSNYQHLQELELVVSEFNNMSLFIQIDNVAMHMASCVLMIGAVGTMTWERCCTGTPSIVASIADNQIPTAQFMEEKGHHCYVGHFNQTTKSDYAKAVRLMMTSEEKLQEQHFQVKELVDGLGVSRVAYMIMKLTKKHDYAKR